MNAIAQRITATPAGSPQEMAMRIKQEAPGLSDLAPDQLEMIAKLVMTQRLTAELNKQVDLAGINYNAEKETFLNNAGRTGSAHTRAVYKNALKRLDAWTARHNINPLELTPAQADDFIYSLRGERAAASIRLDISAVSSFYTWFERRHAEIKNPFRGTKARPAEKAARQTIVPKSHEVKIIIKELPAELSAAASVMAYRGLRAGALSSLTIAGAKFTAHSKGKDISGTMPPEALKEIKAAGLPLRGVFSVLKTNTLEKQIARAIDKLYKTGKIKAAYSCHDLRHFYAITEYRKDNDLYRVQKLLDHASINVTARYLKGLGEID